MILADVRCFMWEEDGEMLCSFCGYHDEGTVRPCEWCGKNVCIEHDDVLENRDIDSGLLLCQPCGNDYDKEHFVAYLDNGQLAGPYLAYPL